MALKRGGLLKEFSVNMRIPEREIFLIRRWFASRMYGGEPEIQAKIMLSQDSPRQILLFSVSITQHVTNNTFLIYAAYTQGQIDKE